MIGKVTFTMENSNEWLKELNDNKAIMSDPSLGSMTTRSKPLTRNGQVSSSPEFRGKLQTQISKWQNRSKNKNSKENLNWKLNRQNKSEITVSESDGNRSSLSSRGMSLVSGGRCSSPVIGSGDQNPNGIQDGRASSPAGLWLKSWNSPSNSRPGSPRSLHVKNKWLNLYGNSKWVIIDSYVLNLGLSVVLIATACIYWSYENIRTVLQCSLSAYKLKANLCNRMSCGISTYI